MPRVYFVDVHDFYGGGQNVMLRLAAELCKQGCIVGFVAVDDKLAAFNKYSVKLPNIFKTNGKLNYVNLINAFIKSLFILKKLKKIEPEILIHCNSLLAAFFFTPWCKYLNLKCSTHIHYIDKTKKGEVLIRWVRLFCPTYVLVSNRVKEFYQLKLGNRKIVVIYNGLPEEWF